jgi:hypothetical protein
MARENEAIEAISGNPKIFAPMIGEARCVLVEQFPYALCYKATGEDGSRDSTFDGLISR